MPRAPDSPTGGSGRTTLLTTLGVLAALAVVAVAARGSTATGEAGARRPSETLLDVLVSLYVVALGLGFLLFLYMLALRRHARATDPSRRGSALQSILVSGFLVVILLLAFRWIRLRDPELVLPEVLQGEPGSRGDLTPPPSTGETYQAEFAWIPMLVLAALVLVSGLAWWRAGKARRKARTREHEPSLAEALADVLAETLDDLRADPDARRAVIRAYARLERASAASGLPRRPAEAPEEYLSRMLSGLEVGQPAVRRLTALFERAKFSHHDVDATMKQDAIRALESVLEDLEQAELRRQAEREAALERMREQARERVRA